MKNETNTQHTPAPWKIWHSGYANTDFVIYSGIDAPFLNSHGSLILGHSVKIAEVYHDESERHDQQKANAQLIARAPELMKENEQLKEKILRGSEAFKHESARFDKEWSIRKKTEAINAELLEAIKNVIGDISSSYGFDARRIPNESVKKALLVIAKAEGKTLSVS